MGCFSVIECFTSHCRNESEAFEDFYFRVCNLDYGKMDEAMKNLIDYMNRTDKVRIVGPGMIALFNQKYTAFLVPKRNIPDGGVYGTGKRQCQRSTNL